MIYQIADLVFDISGNANMVKSEVSYVQPEGFAAYCRKADVPFLKDILSSIEKDNELLMYIDKDVDLSDLEAPDLNITIKGADDVDEDGNSKYVLRRLEKYILNDKEKKIDGKIFYSVKDRIDEPKGTFLCRQLSSYFYKTDTGFSVIRKFSQIHEILFRIDFDFEFNNALVFVFDVSALGGMPIERWIHNVIGEAFSYMALSKGRVTFHSSSIDYNGNGVCFSAPSGTGKSTHTSLWQKVFPETEILNDDTPVLYLSETKEVLVSGTPWSGKTELNINEQISLKGIVRLYQNETNIVSDLKGINAFQILYDQTKILRIKQLFDKGTEVLNRVLETVPVVKLGCNISEEAVMVVKDRLGL